MKARLPVLEKEDDDRISNQTFLAHEQRNALPIHMRGVLSGCWLTLQNTAIARFDDKLRSLPLTNVNLLPGMPLMIRSLTGAFEGV